MEQLTIDFSKPLEHKENNLESQFQFMENVDHFSNQCKIVFEAMLKGERLTTSKALIKYKIGDLRRRCKDLRDHYNVPIEDEYVKDKDGNTTRYKEYYLPKKYIN